MIKRLIATILAISFIFTSLTACSDMNNIKEGLTNNAEKEALADTNVEMPYYYVTNGSIIKERNHYMELEVKIPQIKYCNEEKDPLFDSINEEIENTILKLVDDSKKGAYDTYQKFLETAKTNLENERNKKLDELKFKYKKILTDDEVKAMHEVVDEVVLDIATQSFIHVDGFTSTEEIVNAGPHNKKILIIEKDNKETTGTESTEVVTETTALADTTVIESTSIEQSTEAIKQASISIEGRPGRKKVEAKTDKNTEVVKPEEKEAELPKADFKKGFAKKVATDSYIAKQIKDHFDEAVSDEITKENFYKELKKIRRLRTPNDFSLTMEYLPMYIYCDFDVKCLDEDYISLYINMYETRTQNFSKVLFYNIDLKNKKILGIKDILGENYKDICLKSINSTIENWTEDKKSLLSSNHKVEDFITDDTTFFINNNHIPVVVFDKYAITAGAAGYPEFQIIEK